MNESPRSTRTGSVSRHESVDAAPISRRRGSGQAGHPSSKAAGVGLREISALVRREGPLPPEQAVSLVRQAARDAQSKHPRGSGRGLVFSLGVMLFVALTGLAPRDAHTSNDLSSPPSPSEFSPYLVTPYLDAIVRTCLSDQPESGFASAAELTMALSALSMGEQTTLDHRKS